MWERLKHYRKCYRNRGNGRLVHTVWIKWVITGPKHTEEQLRSAFNIKS